MDIFYQVVDILFKVVSFGGWIVGGIALYKSRKKLRKVEEGHDKTVDEMEQNKKEQLKKEEELKDMAKFLCDKCGAETAVSEAKHIAIGDKEFDLCPKCESEFSAREAEIAAARLAVEQAEKALAEARERLQLLTDNNGADILAKLGL